MSHLSHDEVQILPPGLITPNNLRNTTLTRTQFFTSLTSLLADTTQKTRGSVYLTQKPLLHQQQQPAILIRATDGKTQNPNTPKPKDGGAKQPAAKKTKLSTVVSEEDLEAFYARYAEVCKGGMTGLKKRDRKKGKAKKGAAGKVAKG